MYIDMKDKFDIPPVLLIAFNRPHTAKKVLEAIGRVRPKELYVAVDGPREGNDDDVRKVKEVKDLVKTVVDWPCKVKTLFREKNGGCEKGAIGAVNWFFDNVEEGIVFDDDCVATPDFFRFATEMLEKYRNDERIMHVAGYNFHRGWKRSDYSYYFSKYPYVWGWASWSRAWKKYDIDAKEYPEIRKGNYLKDIYPGFLERKYIQHLLDTAYYKNNDAGDTQWLFSVIMNNGLSIIPNTNLVSNIGFCEDSAHTKPEDSFLSLPVGKMDFPLKHPSFVVHDRVSDKRYVIWLYINKIKKYFLRIFRR